MKTWDKFIDKLDDLCLDYCPSFVYRLTDHWYKLTCFLWKRYTTVKPRYVGHTWFDKSELIPHLMFEALSKFIEEECEPDEIVDWKASGHTVVVNGFEVNVRDEMQDLYDWWHKVYIPCQMGSMTHTVMWDYWIDPYKPTYEFVPSETGLGSIMNYNWTNEESERRWHDGMAFTRSYDAWMQAELDDRLHRLINIRHYLWT